MYVAGGESVRVSRNNEGQSRSVYLHRTTSRGLLIRDAQGGLFDQFGGSCLGSFSANAAEIPVGAFSPQMVATFHGHQLLFAFGLGIFVL